MKHLTALLFLWTASVFFATPGARPNIMATCVELAGAPSPKERGGNAIQPMEGVSLKPLLDGTRIERPQPLFWEHEGNRAIRTGQWKLVSKHPGGWELYDMSADRTEAENLAETMPDRIRELKMLWEARAAKVGIAPWQVLSSERGKPGQ